MKGEYVIAVHALCYMAHKERVVTSAELADSVCSPAPRIRKVMALLKKAGLVDTLSGANGGYALKVRPEEITLACCMRAVEDQPVSIHWLSGDSSKDCLISSSMGKEMLSLVEQLNQSSMHVLEQQTIQMLNEAIFMEDGGQHEII